MLRLIKILISQCRNRSFLEFISVLLKSLFKVEKVLIYAKELDTNYNSTVYSDLDKYIIKGDRVISRHRGTHLFTGFCA